MGTTPRKLYEIPNHGEWWLMRVDSSDQCWLIVIKNTIFISHDWEWWVYTNYRTGDDWGMVDSSYTHMTLRLQTGMGFSDVSMVSWWEDGGWWGKLWPMNSHMIEINSYNIYEGGRMADGDDLGCVEICLCWFWGYFPNGTFNRTWIINMII